MKKIFREIRLITSSMLIGAGILLVSIALWYILFGSCGYVNTRMTIHDMNKIFEGWQDLRDPIIVGFMETGEVQQEQIEIMKGWRDFLYNISPPLCLTDAHYYLELAIENDYSILSINPTDISVGQKMEMLKSGQDKFILYTQSVDLIEACIPMCNWNKDYLQIISMLTKTNTPTP